MALLLNNPRSAIRSGLGDPSDYGVGGGSAPQQVVAAPGAGTVVGSLGSIIVNGSNVSMSVTLVDPVPVGDSVVIAVGYQIGAGRTMTAADSKGNSYRVGTPSFRANTVGAVSIMSKIATALVPGDIVTVTFNAATNSRRMRLYRVLGLKDAPPVVEGAATSAQGTTDDQSFTIIGDSSPALAHSIFYVNSAGAFGYPTNPNSIPGEAANFFDSWFTRVTDTVPTEVGGYTSPTTTQVKTLPTSAWALETVLAPTTGPTPTPNSTPDLYGTTYDDQIIGLNPTNYWRMDEASGAAVFDSINARNGTTPLSRVNASLVVGASKAVGHGGSANSISFSDLASTPSADAPFSVAIWTMTGTSVFGDALVDNTDSGLGFNIQTSFIGSSYCFVVGGNGTFGSFTDQGNTVAPSSLYFVAFTYDGVVGTLYINGQPRVQRAGSLTQSRKLRVGGLIADNTRGWRGQTSHLVKLDRALTDNEILSTYRRGIGNT